MRLGKLDNDELERLVLHKFQKSRKESLAAPEIGVDCAALDLGGEIAVLSCDPITSASISHIGRLSVHVSCNDAAAAGAEPVGLLVTLLAPPSAMPGDIDRIANDLAAAAREANVDVLGGHTEITNAVTRFVTNTTVLAKMPRTQMLRGMQSGDALVMTKWAGLEGSAIIAEDFPRLFERLDPAVRTTALSFARYFNVVPEGRYAAAHGATAMHDVTEGGILGAAWEMAYAAGLSVTIDTEAIRILPETSAICSVAGIDPLRLISSGSMLIACPDGKGMAEGLSAIGIPAAVVGHAEKGSGLYTLAGDRIDPPGADELYRLFSK